MAYDVLCIATGASYTSPWRADDDKLPTFAERLEESRKYMQDVEAASSILCIGGGSTGVETAGYLKEMKKDKKVGLCQRNTLLLPEFQGAHDIAERQLKALGVELMLGQAYNPDEEQFKAWDVVLDCRGFKYLGP